MHSVSTGPRDSRPDAPGDAIEEVETADAARANPPGGVRLIGTLILTLTVLVGCASDRATDQRPARETAQTTQGVIGGDQATWSVERFASPTVTASATAPPPASVVEIGLATGVGGDGAPNGFVVSVPANAGTVYLVADLDGLAAGTVIEPRFYRNVKEPDERTQFPIGTYTAERDGRQWVAIPVYLDGSVPTGDYGLDIWIDGEQIGTIGIQITSPGSQPRSV